MSHFFDRRDWFGNSPAVWVMAVLAFCAPLAWWSLQQIRLENDVENWLPADDPQLKVLHWSDRQFPSQERIVVSWDGSSLGDPRVDVLLEKLEPVPDAHGVPRGGLPQVAGVIDPRKILSWMQKNDVPPAEAVRRLEGVVLGAGPLRVQLTTAGKSRLRRLRGELIEAARRELGIKLKIFDPADDLSATAMIPGFTSESGEVRPANSPAVLNAAGEIQDDSSLTHDLTLTWRGIGINTPSTLKMVSWLNAFRGVHDPAPAPLVERSFFVPGAPIALSVALSEAGLADRSDTIRLIRKAALESGIPAEALKLGGSAVAGTELNREVAHAAWNPEFPLVQVHRRSVILTSALVGALLAFVLVRNVRLALIVLAIAMYTTYLAVSIVPLTGGSMNMVLVVMPTLLLVITLSGGIHVVNYWKHAAAANVHTAAAQASGDALAPCFLAAFTTSIGLASLCTSLLSPVRSFGLYAALGTMLSFVMVVYAVPSLLMLWRGKPPAEDELDHPGWRWLGNRLVRWPGVQAAVVLLLCAMAGYGLSRFRTETKVIRYFHDDSQIVQDYWYLEGHLAGIVPVETIIRFDAAEQEESTFLDRMEAVREVEERLRKHPEITGCIALADFQPVAEPPGEDASVLAKSRYHKRANLIQDRIRSGEFPGTEAFYSLAGEGHDLKRPGDHELNAPGDELWRITSQVNVMTDADYSDILSDVNEIAQDVLKYHPGARHVVTGTVPLFLRTQQAVLDSLISSSLLAFGLILVVLTVQLRSIAAGLVAMIPNVVPITVVFGVISYAGIRVDIGTMITASIGLGMAVDGTLHFLTWFRQRIAEGQTREQAVINALVHCGPAVWQTSWTVALGLLVLVPAELLLISRFGWLMASMVLVALLGDIILLPQLLASPLGRVFTTGVRPPADGAGVNRDTGYAPAASETAAPIDAAASVRFAAES
jgi:predicted RND superfamily exporter protein